MKCRLTVTGGGWLVWSSPMLLSLAVVLLVNQYPDVLESIKKLNCFKLSVTSILLHVRNELHCYLLAEVLHSKPGVASNTTTQTKVVMLGRPLLRAYCETLKLELYNFYK